MPEPKKRKVDNETDGMTKTDENMATPTIMYTKTDEAPALATYSLLPIIRAFVGNGGIKVELRDISLASRIVSAFNDTLPKEQQVEDTLASLGELTHSPYANIIKLPNISASVPQLKAAIVELQGKGYKIPDYPEAPKTEEEKQIQARFKKVLGSAVNPVLREGNSDRRAPVPVKEYAKAHPHRMGKWEKTSKSHVASMSKGDFYENELSVTVPEACVVRIEHVDGSGKITVLKDNLKLQANEIMDSTFLSKRELIAFLTQAIADAKEEGVLFSLHLKATMMKVSDPIMFGHCVTVFFKNVFDKHGATLDKLGVDVSNGLGDLLAKIDKLPAAEKAAIEADIKAAYDNGPDLAMVDSDKGITNLHVPSDIIVDASMPAMIRDSGKMWNKQNKTQDTKCVIPDRCYAGVFGAVIDFCKENGAFDPKTMGTTPNVGLMAQAAEEYGSHDKTFVVSSDGTMRVAKADGTVLMQHAVETGDIWRACQVKDVPVQDWVKLAVTRARATGWPAIFWLSEKRAHDREIIQKVNVYLKDHDTTGLEIEVLDPVDATIYTLKRAKAGQDTISVTGNVLRDYNTDLFPILELNTSAKMLSIVPLLKGGGVFETGAGGSAPKHVQQMQKEGHLRWDSLGEFLALTVSFEHIAAVYKSEFAATMAKTLDEGTTQYLQENKAPSRDAGQLDNRGTHFYLALYWAQALAKQTKDQALAAKFKPVAEKLAVNEKQIVDELNQSQGSKVDLGGYYFLNDDHLMKIMRPSQTFNNIIDSM